MRMRSRKIDPKSVGATAQRIARGDVEVEARNEIDPATGRIVGQRSGHATGLRRYLARGDITSRQHDAGHRFLDDWEAANRLSRMIADLDGVGGGGSDRAVSMLRLAAMRIDARKRYDDAARVLGPCYPVVADVVLANGDPAAWARRRGLHERAGFGVLILALDALADHYAIS